MRFTRLLSVFTIASATTLSGCSSLSSGEQDETLTFTSLPSGAAIQVVDVTGIEGYVDVSARGQSVFTGRTPVTLDLPGTSDDGETLQEYVVVIEKSGYAQYETRLEAVGSEESMYAKGEPQTSQATFLGWRLQDPRTREVSHLPYNQVDVELDNLND